MQVRHRIVLNTFAAVAALLVAGSWVDWAAAETVDVRPDNGRFASQLRHQSSVDEIVAGGHLGDHETSAEMSRQAPKRRIGHAGHRSQQDPIGDLDIAYFQWLKT